MTAQKVIFGLNGLLADATVFYQKLRHYHWDVNGRHFFELHEKFEELYTMWGDAIDAIAERILMLDAVPLHTLASILNAARIREDETIPAAPAMVEAVIVDLRVLHAEVGMIIELAEAAEDRATVNFLDEIRDRMEKDLWMLGAWTKESEKSWT